MTDKCIAVVVSRFSWGREILRKKNRTDLRIVMRVYDTRGIKWAGFIVPDGPSLGHEQYAAIDALRYCGVPGLTAWPARTENGT